MLSGGLDSRAIVAALTDDAAPFQMATFGQDHSAHIAIAARVARVRGGEHHVQNLSPANWIEERFAGVWWTDGQLNLLDMHGAEKLGERRNWFDVNISGFIGDLTMGGSHLGASQQDEYRTIASR